jgi:MOSC domain-containing protein YiiM
MPSIVAVSRSAQHGFSKKPQPNLRLIAGEGVEDDAHRGPTTQHLYLKRKDASLPNLCQVHLLASELLQELVSKGFDLKPGELGENILTTGIDLLSLPKGTTLRLGADALIEITGLRTPCGQIDTFRPGLQQLLWGLKGIDGKKTRRAGIMSIVQNAGVIYPNDIIQVMLPPEPHIPLGPV